MLQSQNQDRIFKQTSNQSERYIDMPLPFILGAAALVTAAYGAKKGYDGYQKHSEADDIIKDAKQRYSRKKSVFDDQGKETTSALEMLGEKELDIGKSLGEFKRLADDLLKKLNAAHPNRQREFELAIPKHELQKIENYTCTAIGVLGTATGAGAAGAAAGFAVYGGVVALGAASTGTAISSLAGAAAYNATMAAIGGGSLAAGGFGMAGGAAILGAAVAAPVLAIFGWAYDSHGEEALSNAYKASREVDEAIKKLSKAVEQLGKTEEYARRIYRTLQSIYVHFDQYFDNLKAVDQYLDSLKKLHGIGGSNGDITAELDKFSGSITSLIENGYALAAILVDVIMTPIFKIKKINDQILNDSNGIPVMEKDADGSMVLNDAELEKALEKGKTEANRFEVA